MNKEKPNNNNVPHEDELMLANTINYDEYYYTTECYHKEMLTVKENARKWIEDKGGCLLCPLKVNLWLCLHCGNSFCGIQQMGVQGYGHNDQHYKNNPKSCFLSLRLSTVPFEMRHIYCKLCDGYVDYEDYKDIVEKDHGFTTNVFEEHADMHEYTGTGILVDKSSIEEKSPQENASSTSFLENFTKEEIDYISAFPPNIHNLCYFTSNMQCIIYIAQKIKHNNPDIVLLEDKIRNGELDTKAAPFIELYIKEVLVQEKYNRSGSRQPYWKNKAMMDKFFDNKKFIRGEECDGIELFDFIFVRLAEYMKDEKTEKNQNIAEYVKIFLENVTEYKEGSQSDIYMCTLVDIQDKENVEKTLPTVIAQQRPKMQSPSTFMAFCIPMGCYFGIEKDDNKEEKVLLLEKQKNVWNTGNIHDMTKIMIDNEEYQLSCFIGHIFYGEEVDVSNFTNKSEARENARYYRLDTTGHYYFSANIKEFFGEQRDMWIQVNGSTVFKYQEDDLDNVLKNEAAVFLYEKISKKGENKE